MQRRHFLFWASALPAWSGTATAQTRPHREWILGHQFPQGSLPDQIARQLAQIIERRSQGQQTVKVLGGAVFGDERQHLALLKTGELDLVISGDLVVSSLRDAYFVFNLPFLYRDTAHALKAYASPLGQTMRQELELAGLRALSWHCVGTRMLTANRPLYTRDDLKGLRLRLPADNAWMAVWQRLGVQTVPVPFPQLSDALRLGQVDAQENPPNFVRTGNLYIHQTHLAPTLHMPQRQFIFASSARWSQLDSAQRSLLQSCATEASAWGHHAAEEEQQRAVQWLTAPNRLKWSELQLGSIEPVLRDAAQALAGAEGLEVLKSLQRL